MRRRERRSSCSAQRQEYLRSVEQAKACVERLKSDEAFRARVMAEEDVEARMALIGALQELGDAELDGVAAGGWFDPCSSPVSGYGRE